MTTTLSTPSGMTAGTVRAVGLGVGLVAATLTTLFAHDWPEVISMVSLIAVVTAGVFGVALPRTLRTGGGGRSALAYAIAAALLAVPAFWTGLPLVLGVAAMVQGSALRNAPSGAGAGTAAVAIGSLASLFYLSIYLMEAVAGNTGFLL